MRTLYYALWATLPMVLFFHAPPTFAQIPCDAPEVKMGSSYIQVAPTGSDDTENIQCALDLAVEKRIPEIRLTRGDFFIGSLLVRGFAGTLQGGGRDHTRLTLLDQAFDCEDGAAAITFVDGEPRVRWFSIIWPPQARPCIGDQSWLQTLLRFTGAGGSSASCSNDLSYATVDRVDLYGPKPGPVGAEPASSTTGIAVGPKPSDGEECSNLLLGTFRLNKSLVSGFGQGVTVDMQGGSTIFVFQNQLKDNHTGLGVDISEAIVAVSDNHIASVPHATFSSCHGNAYGAVFRTAARAPGVRRLDVSKNTFVVADFASWCSGYGVVIGQAAQSFDNSIVVSDNRFELLSGVNGAGVVGLWARGVSGGVVNGNMFHQQSQNDASILLETDAGLFGGWSIVRNGFIGRRDWPDIFLGHNSCCSLIGPNQGAYVVDYGSDNIVLEPQ